MNNPTEFTVETLTQLLHEIPYETLILSLINFELSYNDMTLNQDKHEEVFRGFTKDHNCNGIFDNYFMQKFIAINNGEEFYFEY
ncbi:hypothetical protein [Macrococcoides bohemicum]|uniref:hypothetical protein n=1 Tax=Staphylococcaceae TaxID=90964 RepID=UPI001F0EB130|nr:hypothetical protein [Macrococcus sp. PK]MCH4983780.1 hypothetical protein [Macrococcus sp. PK]